MCRAREGGDAPWGIWVGLRSKGKIQYLERECENVRTPTNAISRMYSNRGPGNAYNAKSSNDWQCEQVVRTWCPKLERKFEFENS